MIEQEVIEGKITRAQQVLDRIESSDFSQKRLLRLDQDVSDQAQAGQFLQNYARVGLLKERLLERVLKPTVVEPTVELAGNLLVSPVAYTFDRENRTLQMGDKISKFREAGFLAVNFLFEHRGHAVDTADLRKILAEAGFKSTVGQNLGSLESRLGQRLFIRIGSAGSHNVQWALGVLAEEEQEPSVTEEVGIEEKQPDKHRLVFLDDNQVELDGVRITLAPKEFTVLTGMAKHVGEEIKSRDFSREALNDPDPKKVSLSPAIWEMKKKLNQPDIFDSKMASRNSWFKLQNVEVVWPEEAQEEIIPEEGPVDGGEIIIVASPPDDVLIIPYEPSEDERRSEEETKILQFIVDILSRNRNITFEDLQRAVHSEIRERSLAGGKKQIPVYQASELKDMFVSVLRKFREEAAIVSLRETWNDDEIALWGNLQLVARRVPGDDWESFSRMVRARIDSAQRTFYNSLPEEERRKRILWIDL